MLQIIGIALLVLGFLAFIIISTAMSPFHYDYKRNCNISLSVMLIGAILTALDYLINVF